MRNFNPFRIYMAIRRSPDRRRTSLRVLNVIIGLQLTTSILLDYGHVSVDACKETKRQILELVEKMREGNQERKEWPHSRCDRRHGWLSRASACPSMTTLSGLLLHDEKWGYAVRNGTARKYSTMTYSILSRYQRNSRLCNAAQHWARSLLTTARWEAENHTLHDTSNHRRISSTVNAALFSGYRSDFVSNFSTMGQLLLSCNQDSDSRTERRGTGEPAGEGGRIRVAGSGSTRF